MDKRIRFETKEEANARREREFLELTPHERFMWFLRSFDRPGFTARNKPEDKGNFVIRKKSPTSRAPAGDLDGAAS